MITFLDVDSQQKLSFMRPLWLALEVACASLLLVTA